MPKSPFTRALLSKPKNPYALDAMWAVLDALHSLGAKTEWITDAACADELTIFWDGEVGLGAPVGGMIGRGCMPALHLDFGLASPLKRFQVSRDRVGAMAPWASAFKAPAGATACKSSGQQALLILQSHYDAGLRLFSPWFENTVDWLDFMLLNTTQNYWVWQPPGVLLSQQVLDFIEGEPALKLIGGNQGPDRFNRSAFIATINSPFAVPAILHHRPVLTYGHSAFRHRYAV
jgi:hypothetical protein